jgi:hypothetical protein
VAGPSASSPCGASGTPPARYDHIVVVMEENRTWAAVGGVGFHDEAMPFLSSLAQQCTVFAQWTETNRSQSSLTQYIGLTSGVDNPHTVDDCAPSGTCRSTDDNIFRQVRLAGGTARSYVEGATSGCSAGGNAAKHIPALYYFGEYTADGVTHSDHDACSAEVRPLSELDVGALPTFAMISPNVCNDGHDCGNAQVDAFAQRVLQPILASATYRAGRTAVMVLYDEDYPVPNLLVAPTATPGVSQAAAGHGAMLATWEQMLGLPLLPGGRSPSAPTLRGPANI